MVLIAVIYGSRLYQIEGMLLVDYIQRARIQVGTASQCPVVVPLEHLSEAGHRLQWSRTHVEHVQKPAICSEGVKPKECE